MHFIWLGSSLPKEFETIIETWKRCHSNWEIKLWTDKEVENFSWSCDYSKWLFNEALTGGEKSDILRYEILYHFGGIYSDLDVICLKSFEALVASDFHFFAGQESNQLQSEKKDKGVLYLSNALIGASPQHPQIKYCIDNLRSQAEAPDETVMSRTGPLLLTRACEEALLNKNKDVLIMPCSYFYPLPYFHDLSHKALTAKEIKANFISPESLALHLWAATWYTP